MKNLFRVMAFSLFLIFGFWGFSNFMIPKIEPAPPPVETKVDLGSMTMDKFIALGEDLFNGKGTCTLCHNSLGRAPMLEQIVTATTERLADTRYAGKATDLESYLIESLIDPSAYVVVGFGKAGSNDTESPMPDVTSGSIGLSEIETGAVVAYLQDLGGADVTVEIPTGADSVEASTETETATTKQEPLNTAEEIVNKYGCGACHVIAGQAGALGPDLSTIGANRSSDYLRRAILDPNVEIAEGYPPNLMPDTYGAQFFAQELEILVDYMKGSGSADQVTEDQSIEEQATEKNTDEGVVQTPSETDSEEQTDVTATPQATSDGGDGEALMEQYGCGACHKFGTQIGAIGPDLSSIGATRDADFLRRAILEPNADITEGFAPMMPPIYAAQISSDQVELIVEYLLGLK